MKFIIKKRSARPDRMWCIYFIHGNKAYYWTSAESYSQAKIWINLYRNHTTDYFVYNFNRVKLDNPDWPYYIIDL